MAKRHGAEFWRLHTDAWRQGELTQLDYCTAHGLSTKSLRRWLRREEMESADPNSTLTLVPVKVVKAAPEHIILHSPGGWRVELPAGEAPWLTDLLRQLP